MIQAVVVQVEPAEKTKESYQVGIIGAGAIGQALAEHFRENAIPVALVDRSSPKTSLGRCQLLLVTVKAYSLADALQQWLPGMADDAIVVVCCNGDVDAVIDQALPRSRRAFLRRGLITFGAHERDARWQILGETGRLYFGAEEPGTTRQPVEDYVLGASHRLQWEPEIRKALTLKWITNTVINSIAAAYRLRKNGEILSAHAEEFAQALDEAIAFASERWPGDLLKPAVVQEKITQIVRDTALNENSMARDVRLGRPTEAAFLSGIVPREQRFATLNALTDLI